MQNWTKLPRHKKTSLDFRHVIKKKSKLLHSHTHTLTGSSLLRLDNVVASLKVAVVVRPVSPPSSSSRVRSWWSASCTCAGPPTPLLRRLRPLVEEVEGGREEEEDCLRLLLRCPFSTAFSKIKCMKIYYKEKIQIEEKMLEKNKKKVSFFEAKCE